MTRNAEPGVAGLEIDRALQRFDYPHKSWAVCAGCAGRGEINFNFCPHVGEAHLPRAECLHCQVADGAIEIPAEYKGPCPACFGYGRVPPAGWVDPVFDEHGVCLDAGTHPELLRIVEARRRRRAEGVSA